MGEFSITHVILLAICLPGPFALFKVFKKAGFNGFVGLAVLIPVIGTFIFYWFAFSKWPSLDDSQPKKAT